MFGNWRGYLVSRDENLSKELQSRGCVTLPQPATTNIFATSPKSKKGQTTFGYRPNNVTSQTLERNTLSSQGSEMGFREAFKQTASIFGSFFHTRRSKSKQKCYTLSSNMEKTSVDYKAKQVNTEGKPYNFSHEELIIRLTPTKSHCPDPQFVYLFLLCIRLYAWPLDVLNRTHDGVLRELKRGSDDHRLILKRWLKVLEQWTVSFPCDFQTDSMKERLHVISRFVQHEQPDLKKLSKSILKDLDRRLNNFTAEISRLAQRLDEDRSLLDICDDHVVFAEQLTVLELERFSKVSSEDFIYKFSTQEIKKTQGERASVNIEPYVAWFNRLSLVIATEICTCTKKNDRVKLINFFIDVGKHCFKTSNFNSLMAIIVGLNMNSVARMRRTWTQANRNGFMKLEKELSPNANFFKYRHTLRQRLSNKNVKCVIPLFALLVKDLTFIHEGMSTILPNGKVNFEKFTRIAHEVKQIEGLKSKESHLTKRNDLLEYLLCAPVCNEEGLYKSSFEVEPPDSNFERDRYQSVKIRVKRR